MNGEYERLQKLIKAAENGALISGEGKYRNGFHIMPPTGWLNDPNGLCQFNDEYHLFFQYSPLDARGGMKGWGHYVTKDFITFDYEGVPFVPDEDFDKNGVYSGSAYIDEQGMHIFYTGNVKLPGNYDYINTGRRADTILVESKDGRSFGAKQVVIDTDEYPDEYSCHIRDPKVWRKNERYYMVLGARTKTSIGQMLVYSSFDMHEWSLYKVISSKDPFGYMWECPDIFQLDNEYVISFSPQGLDAEEYRNQNTYQSGYVLRDVDPLADSEECCEVIDQKNFVEWDMGFDFYAPQTFADNDGRRILVGWAGVPDPGYENGEVEAENWQHCFTVPRCLEIKEGTDGRRKVFQSPIKEIEALRTGKESNISINETDAREVCGKTWRKYSTNCGCMDVLCDNISGAFSVALACKEDENVSEAGLVFSYNGREISLKLSADYGCGRKIRKAELSEVNSLRILVDNSIVEFYVNDGEMVFTTRYYKDDESVELGFDMPNAEIIIYEMNRMKVNL